MTHASPVWPPDQRALLDRFWAGECTPDEARDARTLLDGTSVGQALQAAVTEETMVITAGDLAKSWDAIATRTTELQTGGLGTHTTRGLAVGVSGRHDAHGSTRRAWAGLAAVVLCVIGLTVTLMSRSRSEGRTTRYQTAAGQVSRVVLPGGTVMTLAPATSVAVSPSAVDVVGEAYFTVVPSSGHPFVVRTTNTVVQVLGTAFSVRRYANERRTQVVVDDGKVAVRAKRHGVVSDVPTAMTARMVAQVSDSGVSVTPVSDTRALTGWREGLLVFNDAPVHDVVAEIARCYNAVIRVEGNDLANETLVLEVAVRRQSLSQVLNIVGLAVNAHVRRDGTAYVLVPGRDVATPKERQPQILPQPEKLYGR